MMEDKKLKDEELKNIEGGTLPPISYILYAHVYCPECGKNILENTELYEAREYAETHNQETGHTSTAIADD